MSAAERRLRSELTRLLHSEGVMRGTLLVRERVCGKTSCKCATKGEKHVSLYVTFREDGKARQVYVPKAFEEKVRTWVGNNKKVREILEEISILHYKKLNKRET